MKFKTSYYFYQIELNVIIVQMCPGLYVENALVNKHVSGHID